MPEIDLRGNPWVEGYPREQQVISRYLYRLITIFAASEKLAELATNDEGGCVYSWSIQNFELPEIGRLLLSIAVMIRNDWDANPSRVKGNLKISCDDDVVGELIKDLQKPSVIVPLRFRECLNKILHAYTMNPDRSDPTTIYSGYLNPCMHLYGRYRDKEWKATIEIYRFAEIAHIVV
jgi:hypothetical protein